ncbi:MAG: hypothetical protein HY919_02215 [Elusimicrobia bacterium]|nr:hypothetical protein [Elusimicrobiota bacterium]
MKKSLKNTIFDKKRFEWIEKKKVLELKKMTIHQALKLQKDILDFYDGFKKIFSEDKPVSYEILLGNKK